MKIYEIKNRLAKRAQYSVQADGRAAPPFQGFSAKSGFGCWLFLAKSPAHTQVTPAVGWLSPSSEREKNKT